MPECTTGNDSLCTPLPSAVQSSVHVASKDRCENCAPGDLIAERCKISRWLSNLWNKTVDSEWNSYYTAPAELGIILITVCALSYIISLHSKTGHETSNSVTINVTGKISSWHQCPWVLPLTWSQYSCLAGFDSNSFLFNYSKLLSQGFPGKCMKSCIACLTKLLMRDGVALPSDTHDA